MRLKIGRVTMEISVEGLLRTSNKNTCDPTVPFFSIYQRTMHLTTEILFSTMIIAVMFIIAKCQKQTTCPSTYELIMTMWHIYSMGYYSAVEKMKFENK